MKKQKPDKQPFSLSPDDEHARKIALESVVIPDDEAFMLDFLSDDRLLDLATILIHQCDELRFIEDFTVSYLWKRKGGKDRDKLKLGKCIKTSGLVHYFARTDFVIWLAADHLLYLHLRKRSVNLAAPMYHELGHIDQSEDGDPLTQGHEFEGGAAEIRRFGLWREDMKPIASAFQEVFPFAEQETTH